MTKAVSESVTVRFGPLREPLADYCRGSGVNLSDAIRTLVGQALIQKPVSPTPNSFEDDVTDKVRLELRLTSQEHQAILQRVTEEGFTSANRWVVSLIRANLQKEPEFGETGLDALYESNRQLAPLARNLNQLTRDVRQYGIKIQPYRFLILEQLQKAIAAHDKVIARVISRNVGRWRSE